MLLRSRLSLFSSTLVLFLCGLSPVPPLFSFLHPSLSFRPFPLFLPSAVFVFSFYFLVTPLCLSCSSALLLSTFQLFFPSFPSFTSLRGVCIFFLLSGHSFVSFLLFLASLCSQTCSLCMTTLLSFLSVDYFSSSISVIPFYFRVISLYPSFSSSSFLFCVLSPTLFAC